VVVGIDAADVGQMSGDVARGQIERAIEGDGEMSEVAANAEAALQHVPSGKVGAAGTVAIFDVLVNPLADGLRARPAVGHLAEFFPGEIGELVGVAITTRQRVTEELGREMIGRCRRDDREAGIVRFRSDGENGVVTDAVGAGCEDDAFDQIIVVIDELLGGEIRREGERFEDEGAVAGGARLHVEQEGSGAGHLVGQAAADAHGEVEGGSVHSLMPRRC